MFFFDHFACMWQYFSISVHSLTDSSSCLSFLQIGDGELLNWKELVAKCMAEYRSSECIKPDNKKLVWIVSRRTAQSLQTSHFSVPGLPTIPEMSWDESERLINQFLCFLLSAFNLTGSIFWVMVTLRSVRGNDVGTGNEIQ